MDVEVGSLRILVAKIEGKENREASNASVNRQARAFRKNAGGAV